MCSATDFLPSCIRQFMNLVTTASPNLGSGRTSRLTAARRRDMAPLLSRSLGAVFRAALAPVLDALGVVRAADDVIAHAGQILDPAAADQHHGVLLQIVPLAGDIAGHLESVGEADARNLAQRGIRLFRRRRVDARADPAFLRALLHRRNLVARNLRLARLVDQLVYRRHRHPTSSNTTTARQLNVRRAVVSRCPLNSRPLARAQCQFYRTGLRLGGILPPAAKPRILGRLPYPVKRNTPLRQTRSCRRADERSVLRHLTDRMAECAALFRPADAAPQRVTVPHGLRGAALRPGSEGGR